MYIIDAVPLTRIPQGHPQVLSYYYVVSLLPGSVILAQIRKKSVPMLVVSARALREHKTAVRGAEFQLKPLSRVLFDKPVIPPSVIAFMRWVAEYYYSPITSVVLRALPPKNVILSPTFQKIQVSFDRIVIPKKTETQQKIIWGSDMSALFTLVDKALEKNRDVLIIVPHAVQIKNWSDTLDARDIEHVNYERTKTIGSWVKIYTINASNKARVILGTRAALFAPTHRIGLICVINEESPLYYSTLSKPYYHAVTAAKKLAHIISADIVLTSNLPSVNSYSDIKHKRLVVANKKRSDSLSFSVVDMRKNKSRVVISKELGSRLKKLFVEGAGEQRKAILYLNRKGHATAIICGDCGGQSQCNNCEVSLVYYKTEKARYLLCHHCGNKNVVPTICVSCGGHNLDYRGIGTQKAVTDLEHAFPRVSIFGFDADSFKTAKGEEATFEKFMGAEQAILVTTELIFKYIISQPIDLSAIINFDQLFYIPDFQVEERLRRTVGLLANASKELVVQTYDPDREYLKNLHTLSVSYEKELDARKQFFFPPFSQLIRLVYRHKNPKLAYTQGKLLERKFARISVEKSPALPCFIPKERGLYCMEMTLRVKVPRAAEEIARRNEILKLVPFGWEIFVDPLNVLQ